MNKPNLLLKKLKSQFLSINDSIESFFNQFKNFKSWIKKTRLNEDNKLVLIPGILAILTLSYFLLPTIYNKDVLKAEIKNQIASKYNINIVFKDKVTYSLLPKPHFVTKNLIISKNNKEIGKVKKFKVFISSNRFFAINKIEVRDILFHKTEFNISKTDFNFFSNLLNISPTKDELSIKNSSLFYKDEEDNILFIKKINDFRFFYDFNNSENIAILKSEIFNTPIKLNVKKNKKNEEIYSKLTSKKIRLDIENYFEYENRIKNGNIDILLVNKETSIKYNIDKNSLNFKSKNRKNIFNGFVDFKPFYFLANFNYERFKSKLLFNDDSIFIDLIKSELLNNQNLNVELNFKVKQISDIVDLNNLLLKIKIEEGNIIPSNSQIMWKDDLQINLIESLLNYNEDEINLTGSVSVEAKDIIEFYKSFQIKKKNRKKINKINFDFNYNFTQKEISFDNIKINDVPNIKIDEFINKYNLSKKKILNKITFKNFVNNLFEAYAS